MLAVLLALGIMWLLRISWKHEAYNALRDILDAYRKLVKTTWGETSDVPDEIIEYFNKVARGLSSDYDQEPWARPQKGK